MKLLSDLFRATLLLTALATQAVAGDADPALDKGAREAFAARVKEAKTASAVVGKDGWLFLTAELRFLSLNDFWGAAAAKVSRAPKADLADPLAAIVDFQKQLKARGVDLLLVPVPPKAAIHSDKILEAAADEQAALAPLRRFQAALSEAGVEVLDLAPQLAALCRSSEPNETPYCKTDTHWSPAGCQAAAKSIAAAVQRKLGPPPAANPFAVGSPSNFAYDLEGDLGALLAKGVPKPAKEQIQLRQITNKATGKGVEPDPASPVLLMGDSHTLVFHAFGGERAGLLDQLAFELGAAPDFIGVRGSGSTEVRKDLYRKSVKDPGYLAKKKLVVWCFTARDFTESDQGWAKLPVAK